MKLAVLKIGGRLATSGRSSTGGTNEVIEIFKRLNKYKIQSDLYTRILPSDKTETDINIIDLNYNTLKDLNKDNYDLMLVFNGNANFFGGAEDELAIMNYIAINNFNGKVVYCLTDLNLILKQIKKSVDAKEWGKKYLNSDILIERKDIYVLSQAVNNNDICKRFNKNEVSMDISNIKHFPWEMFPVFALNEYNKLFRPIDIIYGGTFRGGKREKDIVKYYFGYPDNIKVEMFGNIKLSQFKRKESKDITPPNFSKKLAYPKYIEKTATGLSSVIIADPMYKHSGMRTTRFFECIKTGVIVFIDKDYYKNTDFFIDDNTILKDMCIVNDKYDIIDKIEFFKSDSKFRNKFIELQRKAVSFITEDYYYNKLKGALEEIYND